MAGFFSHPKNVAPDVAQILRIEAENLRAPVESREGRGEIVGRGGANVAQVLRDNQVRRHCFQQLRVNGVQTFAAVNILANERVDFCRRGAVRHARVNDHRLRAGPRREVAFVADADDFTIKTKCEEYLGSGGKERDDAHDQETLAQSGNGYL
jgi:hypothetical protein